MKNFNLRTILTLILITAVLFGCKKEDEPEVVQEPDLQTQVVTPPDAMVQSQDPGAQQAIIWINMSNAFAGLAGTMTPPEEKGPGYKAGMDDGPPWVYSWSVNDASGNYTVTLTVDEYGNGYEWEMKINGEIDGAQLNNFVYMHAEQSEDGQDGSFEFYDPETQQLGMQVAWQNSSSVYHVVFEIPNEIKITTNSYSDNSGDVEVMEWDNGAYYLIFEASWTSSGSGEWWMYDLGELYDSGSW